MEGLGFGRSARINFPNPVLTVDHDISVENMFKIGNYVWENDKVTSVNFPAEIVGKRRIKFSLFCFFDQVSLGEITAEMDLYGSRPMNIRELLTLGHVHPDYQRKLLIFALGSSWSHPDGRIFYPALDGSSAGRVFKFIYPSGSEKIYPNRRWCFASVENS